MPCEVRNEARSEGHETGHDAVSDRERAIALRHHAKTFCGINQDDAVRGVLTQLGAGGTGDGRNGRNYSGSGRALRRRTLAAAPRTKTASEIPDAAALRTRLINDGGLALRPIALRLAALAHRTRSRTKLTCEDRTPPFPCRNATEASRTCRSPARSVICRWVSTRCAIAPPTPQ